MLEKKTLPYEFLARWTDGKLAGAHVGFITQIVEDGVVIQQSVGEVMPVDVGAGKGYPLSDIMSQLHIDALVEVDALKATLVTVEAQVNKTVADLEAKAAAQTAADKVVADKAAFDAVAAQVAPVDVPVVTDPVVALDAPVV